MVRADTSFVRLLAQDGLSAKLAFVAFDVYDFHQHLVIFLEVIADVDDQILEFVTCAAL